MNSNDPKRPQEGRGTFWGWVRRKGGGQRREAEKGEKAGPYGLIAAETGGESFPESRPEETQVAEMAGEDSWKKGWLKKNGNQEKGRSDTGDPDHGKGNRDGKKKDFLVWQGGGEAEEEGVEKVERVHRNGRLEERDGDHRDHADEEIEVEVKGAEGFLQCLPNGPKEPKKDEKEDEISK